MAGKNEVFEYRGVDNVVIAEVTGDDNETDGGYKTGTVKKLVPAAEVGKTVTSSSATRYYDNKPALNITSEGPDEIAIRGAGMDIETLAWISGKSYDETTGALIDGPRKTRYFAVGYRTKDTNGNYRYVWRFKGTFAPPAETVVTEDDGTEGTGTELTFTGIHTNHVFTKGVYNEESKKWEPATSKGIVVDSGKGLADISTFFDQVTTADTLKPKTAA
jgi:phi13 family phage major tail protein